MTEACLSANIVTVTSCSTNHAINNSDNTQPGLEVTHTTTQYEALLVWASLSSVELSELHLLSP